MLKVGLTGGIGCGKSSVSDLFHTLGIPVLDADTIAHQLTGPNQPALKDICQQFGLEALNTDGTLNRPFLRDRVFTNPIEKQKLEAILHPRVFAEIHRQTQLLSSAYCILSIPLLLETNMSHFVDRILVVDCPVEYQVSRVKQRSQLSEARIRTIIDSQVSREERNKRADDIIDNTGTHGKLAEQVKKLHNLYMTISAETGKPSP